MKLNRVILTTGGTGGHIFPALAVADEIRRRNPHVQLLFIGGSGPEGNLATKHGIPFQELPAKGVMGRGIKGLFGGIKWLLTALPKALKTIKEFQPDVIIGFGGYAGFCPVLVGVLANIPTAIHEQNSVPGMTNKILGRLVKRIFLSFHDECHAFKKYKTMLTGTPVRHEIQNTAVQRLNRLRGKRILVLGGSQGARPLNDAVVEALPMLLAEEVMIVHQAGKADYERMCAAYEAAGANPSQVHGFIDDIASEYAWADIALCRSGASTIFEIATAGIPAIFVPFPQATQNHQMMNAKAMAEQGAAQILPQDEMTGKILGQMTLKLLNDEQQLTNMEKTARTFAKRRAAAHIVTGLEALVG